MTDLWIASVVAVLFIAGGVPVFSEEHSANITVIPKYPQPRYDDNGNALWFPRIIGGLPVGLGEIPGKISIQFSRQGRAGSHFCGGTLIGASHVVTAAHCLVDDRGRVLNARHLQLMGDDTTITANASPTRQMRRATQLFVHPQYDAETFENDIAVIRVRRPFNQTGSFAPMRRAFTRPGDNTTCRVAGWGATVEEGPASPILLGVEIKVIPTRTCNSSTSYRGMIRQHMFCAGTMLGGRDSCQGDSGGGLICNSTLAGVVSFGLGCGRPKLPGVYTDLSAYNQWIERMLAWPENKPAPTPRPNGGSSISLSAIPIALLFITCHALLF